MYAMMHVAIHDALGQHRPALTSLCREPDRGYPVRRRGRGGGSRA